MTDCMHMNLPGADPWVVADGEISAGNGSFTPNPTGRYYYCYSTGNGVGVAAGNSIVSALTGQRNTVYTAQGDAYFRAEFWAPELHKIDGRWYIYAAADDGDNFHHRMLVLRARTDDPCGPFDCVGKITDSTDRWAIDATILEYAGRLYFIWSGWEGEENVRQNLYIAPMSDPCTISGPRVMISTPDREWEKRGGMPSINEGPAALVCGRIVHLAYSASGSWCDDYCIAALTCRNGDLLNPAAWEKSDGPLMEKAPGAYGPGHCSFAMEDGQLHIIYHANAVSGTSWGGRSVRVQPARADEEKLTLGRSIAAE